MKSSVQPASLAAQHAPHRVEWVDYAKGLCIIMVVMMHSTLSVESLAGETSWMGALVAFAKPFRMPDFFLISGLFLARVIDRPWRSYLDTKVVHFAYFYVIWVTIQFAFKAPGLAAETGLAGVLQAYALAFVQPFGTLWFIYLLPVFFVVAKLTRSVSPAVLWPLAALLQTLGPNTGLVVVDEFCARFVYFYSGYVFSAYFFAFADTARQHPFQSLLLLCAWALFEVQIVLSGYSELPLISLNLGFLGALAIVMAASLLSLQGLAPLIRYAGENSIVIYLAFFLPMAATRAGLMPFSPMLDTGTIALIVTTAGVLVPLVLYQMVRGTMLRYLFVRPDWAKLTLRSAPAQPKAA